MSRRRRPGLAPTLFPFLAVLVCTLGTLILLLAVVAQDAKDTAARGTDGARAESDSTADDAPHAESTPRRDDVTEWIEDMQLHARSLESVRAEQTAEIEQQRDQKTALEDHVVRIRDELSRLNAVVEQATAEANVDSPAQAEVSKLEAELASARAKLDQVKADSEYAKPRIVIVPHAGPNGTHRRPIYLECDAKGVTVYPEGVLIPLALLRGARRNANPLDAALRAARHHALQVYGDKISPYPMLILRPDGIQAYRAARGAMGEWDDQYGYELVPRGVDLAFGNSDPVLKERVEAAVRQAAATLHAADMLAARFGGSGRYVARGYGDGRGSGGRGNSSDASPGPPQRRYPTLSAKALQRDSQASGFRSLSRGGFDTTGISALPGELQRSRRSNGKIRDAGSRSGSGVSGRELAGERRSGQDFDAEMRAAATAMRAGAVPDSDSGDSSESENAADGSIKPNRWASNQGASNQGASNTAESSEAATSSTTARNTTARNTTSPSGATARQLANSPGGAGGANASPSSQSQPPTASGTPGSPSSGAGQPPPINRDRRDWALPPELVGQRGTAVVRRIRVRCEYDQLVLMPSRSDRTARVFRIRNGDIRSAAMQLAAALRDRIASWGTTLPGGRWEPTLQLDVGPHARTRSNELRTLLRGSGLKIQIGPQRTAEAISDPNSGVTR